MATLEFIWNAEVIVDRGPVDEPLFISAMVTYVGDAPNSFTDLALENNAVKHIAEKLGEDPAAMTVVSLTWTDLPKN